MAWVENIKTTHLNKILFNYWKLGIAIEKKAPETPEKKQNRLENANAKLKLIMK